MPWTTLVAGNPILASWANANVRDQTVAIFASAAARASAIASPAQGQLSYLQDTKRIEQYQTATTGWTLPWGLPWGYLASTGSPAGTAAVATGTGGTETTDGTVTTAGVNVPANRRIRVSGTLRLSGSSQFFGDVRIRRGTSTAGTEIARTQQIVGTLLGSNYATFSLAVVDTPAATASLRYCLTGAGGDLYQPSFLLVEDVGPAGNPT